MRMYLSRTSIFAISVFIGLVAGYFPAVWYFPSGGKNIVNSAAFIDTSFTTLRGVITGVDTKSGILTLLAVSPYSPYEAALFSATFDDSTIIRSIPANPESPNLFLTTSDYQTIDAQNLVAGAPVTVRVSRDAGPLYASWIAVRAAID